jgi:ABC-type multidrug transport system fused ATPase/permease subunit
MFWSFFVLRRCGKSSLMVALFRVEDLVSGQILIDDIDISRIPLNILRNKLCIIPQDPVMFSASVRFNIDPFDEHSDAEVWDVLENVNMKEHIMSLPNKLTEMVAEGGDNFSAGQRQVICFTVCQNPNSAHFPLQAF